MNFEYRNLPRGIILLIDMIVCILSLILAYLLRFNFEVPENEIRDFPYAAALVLTTRFFVFCCF